MKELEAIEQLIERGGGSVAFFTNGNGKYHCVVKYLGNIKKPSCKYFGSGETLIEAINDTLNESKPKKPVQALPGVTHQPPKHQHAPLPGLTTR
jgi:hypothetical protein